MDRKTLTALVPVAGAIGVFGVIYGAAADPLFGLGKTLASSALIFSGVAQFTLAGLALGGASPLAIVTAVILVNSRNVALGAVVRPHLYGGPFQRAGLAWFLIDEVVGLAVTNRAGAARILLGGGLACYGAWLAGTVVGALGGDVVAGMEEMAAAVFPVLFVGLAAMAATTLSLVGRAVAAAVLTVALVLVWPAVGALAPVIAAAVVAWPAERRPTS